MIEMESLHTASILYNLRIRFDQDIIYTYMGGILISVNPFKLIDLFSQETVDAYVGKTLRDNPPHIYATADSVYRAILRGEGNQSVIISGESGAGKTEAAKIVLQYVAEVAARNTSATASDGSNGFDIHEMIMASNPILEAFGNAKTVRNHNSSRFGKLLEAQFGTYGGLLGASFQTFLLEKSRVTKLNAHERNFHVFYYLLSSVDAAEQDLYQLRDLETYHYLNQVEDNNIPSEDRALEFDRLKAALTTAGFSLSEQREIFTNLALILWLGNINFTSAEESKVENWDVLNWAAYLFGCDTEALETALLTRTNTIKGEVFLVPLDRFQAVDARDTLSQHIYARTFDWIVAKLNSSLRFDKKHESCIYLLDVFGFEIFERNSFEQLCINYANERLQLQFNEYVFRLEQNEYAQEGIEITHINFTDNQGCIDLIEQSPVGILFLINEEAHFPKGTDQSLLSKIITTHSGSEYFEMDRFKGSAFCINHFAGKVRYDMSGFLSKNRERFSKDLIGLIAQCKNVFLKQTFSNVIADSLLVEGGKKQKATTKSTLALEFRRSLMDLCDTLYKSQPNFIRCIKSNDQCLADQFQNALINRQLRYIGALETIRIRQEGFAQRRSEETFLDRYWCIVPLHLRGQKPNISTLLEVISEKDNEGIVQGTTKIFIKAETFEILEKKRYETKAEAATYIQTRFRAFRARRFFRCLRLALATLSAAISTYIARMDNRLLIVSSLENLMKPQSIENLLTCTKVNARNVDVIFDNDGHSIIISAILSSKSPGQRRALIKLLTACISSPHHATLLSKRSDYPELLEVVNQFQDVNILLIQKMAQFLPNVAPIFHDGGLSTISKALPDDAAAASTLSSLLMRGGLPAASKMGRDTKLVQQIIHEITRSNFSAKTAYLTQCLSALCKDKHNIQVISDLGGVEAVFAAWTRSPESADMANWASQFIASLLKTPGMITGHINFEEDLFPHLLNVLDLCPESASNVLPLIVDILRLDESAHIALDSILLRHRSAVDGAGASNYLSAMEVILNCPGNARIVHEIHALAVQSCLEKLSNFSSSSSATQAGLKTLEALMERDASLTVELLKELDGLQTVAHCVRLHRSNDSIVGRAIQLFQGTISADDIYHAVQDLATSLQNGSDCSGLVEKLAMFALSEENLQALVQTNSIPILLSVIQHCTHHPDTQINAIFAITEMASSSSEARRQMKEENGLQIIKSAVHAAPALVEAYFRFVALFSPESIYSISEIPGIFEQVGSHRATAHELVSVAIKTNGEMTKSWVSLLLSAIPLLDDPQELSTILELINNNETMVIKEEAVPLISCLLTKADRNNQLMSTVITFVHNAVKGQTRLSEQQRAVTFAQVKQILPHLESSVGETALLVLCELCWQSEELLVGRKREEHHSFSAMSIDQALPKLITDSLRQIDILSDKLQILLSTGSENSRRSAVVSQADVYARGIDEKATLISALRRTHSKAVSFLKNKTVPRVIHSALKSLTMADETPSQRSALVAIAALLDESAETWQLLDALNKFPHYDEFSYMVIPILIQVAESAPSGEVAQQLVEQGLINTISQIVDCTFASKDVNRACLSMCQCIINLVKHRPSLPAKDIISCMASAVTHLDLDSNSVRVALSSIRVILDYAIEEDIIALGPEIGMFVWECMSQYWDDAEIQLQCIQILHKLAQNQAFLKEVKWDMRLQNAIRAAVEKHFAVAEICKLGLDLISLMLNADATEFLETSVSDENMFILNSKRSDARREYGKVLRSEGSPISTEFLLSVLKAHGGNKTIAKQIMRMLCDQDAESIASAKDVVDVFKDQWVGDTELLAAADNIDSLSASLQEQRDDQILTQQLIGNNASFLIMTMRSAPSNMRLAIAALKILNDSTDEFLLLTDIEKDILFLMQTHWSGEKQHLILANSILKRIRVADLPIVEAISFNESQEAVEQLCNDVIEAKDSSLSSELTALQRLLQALNRFPEDVDLSVAIATGIWRLINAQFTNEKKSAWRGAGIVAIIRALYVHINSASVLLWLTRILSILSEDEQLKSLIGIHGGIPAIFNVARAYFAHFSQTEELFQSCIETVALVAYRNPANIAEVVKEGGIALVISVLDQNSSPGLAISALVALTNISYMNNANKVLIVEQGGGRVAAQALDRPDFAADTVALQVAMKYVATLAAVPDNADRLINDNVVKLIGNIIKKHFDNVQLSEQASQTVQNLSGCNAKSKDAIVRQKGVQIMLSLWEKYTGHPAIILAVLNFLHKICSVNQNSAIPALICKLGGLDLLLKQVEILLSQDAETSSLAISLLADLSFNEQICNIMIDRSIPTKAIKSGEEHDLDFVVVKSVLNLISVIANSSELACADIATQGAIEWPQSLMERRRENVELLTECIKCWTVMIGSPENVRNSLPFIIRVAELLQQFPHNVQFVKSVAGLWCGLAMYPTGTRQMLEHRCINLILLSLAANSDSAIIIEKFVRTLTNMVVVEMASYSVLLREKAPKLVKELMSRHTNNKVTMKACQKFLTRMDELAAMDAHIGSIRDRVPKDMLHMITAGAIFRKMPKGNHRLLSVSEDCQYLIWQDPKGSKSESLGFCHVSEIRPGACTADLQKKSLTGRNPDPASSFAVFNRLQKASLSFEAQTPEAARAWLIALELLQKLNQRGNSKESFENSNHNEKQ
uniref:Myosin motor domain-containing protein n=1 Tax=Spongospora subterranea TaxID=70186 RepID=A0A0H5RAS0_9EUKA|eukprot:CRZ11265.1 hypothetical protein [Spongospora subterranea]